jgi:hypothetical protein
MDTHRPASYEYLLYQHIRQMRQQDISNIKTTWPRSSQKPHNDAFSHAATHHQNCARAKIQPPLTEFS